MATLRKFEGSSLDELLQHVYRVCGPDAQILEANRVRRGGVAGFFAREGFEVVVSPEPGHDTAADPADDPVDNQTVAKVRGTHLDQVDVDDEDGDLLVSELMDATGQLHTAPGPVPARVPVAAPARSTLSTSAGTAAPQLLAPPAAGRVPAGVSLLGLIDETNGLDQREAVSFERALDDALHRDGDDDRDDSRDDDGNEVRLTDEDVQLLLGPAPSSTGSEPTDNEEELAPRPGKLPPGDEPGDADPEVTMAAERKQAEDMSTDQGWDRDLDEHEVAADVEEQDRAAIVDAFVGRAGAGSSISASSGPDPVAGSDPFPGADPFTRPEAEPRAEPRAVPEAESPPLPGAEALTGAGPRPGSDRSPAGGPVPASVFELLQRYGHLPEVPPAPTGAGPLVVLGDLTAAMEAAGRLARTQGDHPVPEVVLASPEPPANAPRWSVVTTPADARERTLRWGRRGDRAIVAVELTTGATGLAWVKRIIDALEPTQVRLAVTAGEPLDEARAAIELLGAIAVVDVLVHRQEGRSSRVDPDDVLSLGAPVASVDGYPASPALWAALTLEGGSNG